MSNRRRQTTTVPFLLALADDLSWVQRRRLLLATARRLVADRAQARRVLGSAMDADALADLLADGVRQCGVHP